MVRYQAHLRDCKLMMQSSVNMGDVAGACMWAVRLDRLKRRAKREMRRRQLAKGGL